MGQAEAGSVWRKVGVYDEGEGAAAEGGVGCEGGESGFVGVVRMGAAAVAAAHGAGKDGACETGWISQCQAQ